LTELTDNVAYGIEVLRIRAAQKQAEEALRESEEQFRTLSDSIPNLAWWANADGYITWYNRRWYEYTGTTPEQMEGWGWQSVHDPQVLPQVLERWKSSIATGSPFDMEFPLRGADGIFRPFLTRVMPLKNSEGKVLRWFGTNTDITELKKAEQDILKLSEDMAARNLELESLNKELESFIYSVSHDLRAPIRTMSGFAKIIVEDYAGKLDVQGQDYLNRILRGSERSTQLIDDLLHLSRISRQELDRIEIDLSKKASKVAEELREMNQGRNVEVIVQQGMTALADPRLIELALSNLLENAWKFTSKTKNAKIEFGMMERNFAPHPTSPRQGEEISQSAIRNPQSEIVYFIRDNGAGFNMQYADKMFWPFHRLHSDREFEGTGIGLTIVERIVRRHGGKVWAEGEVGKGATVFFTL
jgi:PAS domain S-box-containing protein